MQTIALIEDDRDLRELLRYRLQREGYRLVANSTGRDAAEFLMRVQPDLLLLDVMLPDKPGWDICREIRSHPQLSKLTVIFLTARGSEVDRVMGLEIGADDYLVKPFFMRELIARIKLRLDSAPAEAPLVQAAGLELDRERFEVRREGTKAPLTATEFRLLSFLMNRPGRVYSRTQLLDEVWGSDRDVAERAVDVCVLRLRRKLQDSHEEPRWIRSVRGFGYAFDPVTPGGADQAIN